MDRISRRRVLAATAAVTTTGLAGCTGGGEPEGDGGSTPTATAASGGGESDGSDGGGSNGGDDDPTATASADPDCSSLSGRPTPYDASGTPFVFTFDYVDSWTLQDPLEGPGGMIQGIASPTVTVDGETESAGLTVGQKFEALTTAEVDELIDEATSGDYSRYVVAEEQSFGDRTVQFLGFADTDIPFYQTWVPHGDGEPDWYELTLMLNTSILRAGDGPTEILCLETTVPGIETVRESLAPNPDTTIAEVRDA